MISIRTPKKIYYGFEIDSLSLVAGEAYCLREEGLYRITIITDRYSIKINRNEELVGFSMEYGSGPLLQNSYMLNLYLKKDDVLKIECSDKDINVQEEEKEKKCTCSSYDLFNFGCRCGGK